MAGGDEAGDRLRPGDPGADSSARSSGAVSRTAKRSSQTTESIIDSRMFSTTHVRMACMVGSDDGTAASIDPSRSVWRSDTDQTISDFEPQ